jgi:hypothetical protein
MKTTVAELIEYLKKLPQDLLVVRDAGGDAGGFIDLVSSPEEEADRSWFKTEEFLLAPALETGYHGQYDSWENILKAARDLVPKKASDEEALSALADHLGRSLAEDEEEAAKIKELPEKYNKNIWTLEAYRDDRFNLSSQRKFLKFLRQDSPIRAIVLR